MTRLKKSAKTKKTPMKKHKIAKRKTRTQNKNTKAKPNPSTRSPRKHALILQKLAHMENKSKSVVLNELVQELDRSYESLRDRVKRYIGRLSSNGKKEVLKQAKVSKDLYLHLAPAKGAYRDIISINESEPSVLNIKSFNKMQKKK